MNAHPAVSKTQAVYEEHTNLGPNQNEGNHGAQDNNGAMTGAGDGPSGSTVKYGEGYSNSKDNNATSGGN